MKSVVIATVRGKYDSLHEVRLVRKADGQTVMTCDCQTWKNGGTCRHIQQLISGHASTTKVVSTQAA